MPGSSRFASRRALVLAPLFAATACSSSSSSSHSMSTSAASAQVTYHADVEPIVQVKCQGCHVAGGIAPFPLTTYADAKPYAALIASYTASGAMPPWGAVPTSDCTPRFDFQNDPRLTPAQIQTIQAWNAAGAPEGDPADAPPPNTTAPVTGLPGMQLELTPPAAYTLANGMDDDFRCFVLDPKLAATSFVNGTFVVPGNETIVHHALVFTDTTGASAALVTDPTTQSYECFGGPGFDKTSLVTAWAPGGNPIEYPSDVGQPLDPGTLLVMQVHYHPHGTTVPPGPDQTSLQMRFTASTPTHIATAVLAGNFTNPVTVAGMQTGLLPGPDDPASGPVFDIPPNVNGHIETMQIAVPSGIPQVHLLGVAGHEHYVGTSVEITIARQSASPASECLLSIPQWDFNWQRFYMYDTSIDQLPTAQPGDVIQVKCTYDNTFGNAQLAQSLAARNLSQPQDVKLGETTLDEMCLGAFVYVQ